MIKAVSYNRKSTDDNVHQIQSISDQMKANLETSQRLNIHIDTVLIEKQSASKLGRPYFKQMIEEIMAKKYSVIFVWNTDRLARNAVDGGQIIWLLQSGHIEKIITPQKEYTKEDILLLYVEFGMSNLYTQNLSKNVKRGIKSKIMAGGYANQAPMGYLNKDGEVIIDKELFFYLKEAWQKLIYQDQRPYEILAWLNENNVKINSKPIFKQRLYEIFRNRFYAGQVQYEGIFYKGRHPAMISEEEFDKAQILLAQFGRKSEKIRYRRFNPNFILNKTIKCINCGANMSGGYAKGTFGYYRCHNAKCSSHQNINKVYAESIFLQQIDSITFSKEDVIAFRSYVDILIKNKFGNITDLLEIKREELDRAKAKIKRLELLLIDGKLSSENYDSYKQEAQENIISLETEVKTLYNSSTQVHNVVDTCTDYLYKFNEKYRSLPIEDKTKINQILFPKGFFF